MTTKENLLGTTLKYPENWELSGPVEDADGESLMLESPDGMFFAINRYDDRNDTENVLSGAIDAMQQEYSEIEIEEYESPDAIEDEIGKDLQFYCNRLVVTSRIVAIQQGQSVFLIQIQAEDRDFDRSELVFEAMLKSIRDGFRD